MNTGLKIFGIPLYIGIGGIITISILLWNFGSILHSELQLDGIARPTYATVLTIGVLMSVLLHEIGHAVTHMLNGGIVQKIQLTFLGGAAYLEETNQSPRARILTSAAGPAVNIALWILLLTLMQHVLFENRATNFIVNDLARINLILGAFNLAPLLPLDGGYIVQETIWSITGDKEKAERISNNAGKAVSYGMIIVGVALSLTHATTSYSNYLIIVGIIAFDACSRGRKSIRGRSAARKLVVHQAFEPFQVIHAQDKLLENLGFSFPNTVYLVKDSTGCLVGSLQTRLISPSKVTSNTTVADVMGPVPEFISRDISLYDLLEMDAKNKDHTVYVSGSNAEDIKGAISSIGMYHLFKKLSKAPKTAGALTRIMAFGE